MTTDKTTQQAPDAASAMERVKDAVREALSAAESCGHPLGGASAARRSTEAEVELWAAIAALPLQAAQPEPLTDHQCDEFRRLPLSFRDMVRAIYAAGQAAQPEPAAAAERSPLTDDRIESIRKANLGRNSGELYALEFARAIESALAAAWGVKLAATESLT